MILLLSILVACGGGGDGPLPGNNNNNNGGNSDDGLKAPARDADETVQGDLSEGSTIGLGWAERNYCWPATENVNFDGAHVHYTRAQARGTDLILRVAPEAGVDVSLYAIQSSNGAQVPPDVNSPFDCSAMYDQQGDSNPGQAELLFLQNYLDFDVVIGVAGAGGRTSGAYTLQIWREAGAQFDTAR